MAESETGETPMPQETPAPEAPKCESVKCGDPPNGAVALPIVVPKLTSRKCGSLLCWVVDRCADSRADPCPSPISPPPRKRDESPETPSFKPSKPPRVVRDQDESGEAGAKKIEDESQEDPDPQEPDSDGSDTETYSPSHSPCSDVHDVHGPPGFAYGIPMWPCYFPMAGYQQWYDVNDLAAQHLEACRMVALKRAEGRGARTKDICGIGCCCTRCIGFPAAFAPPEKIIKKRKNPEDSDENEKEDDEIQGRDCDIVSVVSVERQTEPPSSTSDSDSDSDMDAEEILQQLPPNLTWVTTDPRLQHLTVAGVGRTVVCTKLHPEATAMDVQQAFEHRFLSIPEFVEGYWKSGVTSSAVVTVRKDSRSLQHSSRRCFVAFFDNVLASTALLFDGLEICGQRLQLRRPHEYSSERVETRALDVSILFRLGMLTTRPSPPGPNGATSKAAAKPRRGTSGGLRHLYIGNLPAGHQTLQDVTELVTCVSSELKSYKPEAGPAMLSASCARGGWLVEMQSPELARDAQSCLRQMVLDGVQPSVYLAFGPEEG